MNNLILTLLITSLSAISYGQNQSVANDNCSDLIPDFTFKKYLPAGGMQFNDQTLSTLATPHFYRWDFGNGESSSHKSPLAVFDEEKDYVIELVVTDSLKCTSIISKKISWSMDN